MYIHGFEVNVLLAWDEEQSFQTLQNMQGVYVTESREYICRIRTL